VHGGHVVENPTVMEPIKSKTRSSSRRRYVVALMLGTALSALGPATPSSAAEASPATLRAVNDLSRYCTTCWRNARLPADCWSDCTQEVFIRLLERVPQGSWDLVLKTEGDERREFVRAIDTIKKRVQRGRTWASGPLDEVADRRDSHDRKLADDRETVRRAAADLLSPRQQRILQLSCAGWSVQDMAAELEISPERVSDEKYKAIQKLRSKLGPEMGKSA
jgi:RNA polymerase sigma factor (sigma-70 family)